MAEVNVAGILTLFNSAMTMVNQYKAARQQWREANPNDEGQLPDERPLFDLLVRDSQHLKDHAAAVMAKYAPTGVVPAPVPEEPQAPNLPPAIMVVVRVSAWRSGALVLPAAASLRLDDGREPVAFEAESGRLKFTLPGANYGWHGLLDIDGAQFHVTLAPDLDVNLKPAVTARTGVVSLANRTMVDAGGPFLALGASLFWAPWGMKNDRARTEDHFGYFAAHRADYLRQLLVVGPGGRWEDRTSSPQDPGWDQSVADAIDGAYRAGLRTQPTIFGGVDNAPTKSQRREVVQRFADIVRGREEKIQYTEIANEGWQNGFSGADGAAELQELAAMLKSLIPNLVVRTCPGPDGYRADGPDLTPWHLDRSIDGTGGIWRPTRQTWDPSLEGKAWTNQEGIGIGSSVNADPDVLRGICYGLNTWICGGAAHTVHHGAGIRGGGQADLEKGRAVNAWDQPTLGPILEGLVACRALLPADLPNFTALNSNDRFPAYPFDTKILVEAIDVKNTLLRAFCAMSGGRFVLQPIAVGGPVPFVAKQAMRLEAFNPRNGRKLLELLLNPGQALNVVPDPEPALLILGQYL